MRVRSPRSNYRYEGGQENYFSGEPYDGKLSRTGSGKVF